MFEDQFRKPPFSFSSTEEEAKHFLFFDHSDDQKDHIFSRQTEPFPYLDQDHRLILKRAEYKEVLLNNNILPRDLNSMMNVFIKKQRKFRRQLAKQRNLSKKLKQQQQVIIEEQHGSEQIDSKMQNVKRKKRLSAQVSRDRKRKYLRNLQQQNKELRQMLVHLKGQKIRLQMQLKYIKFGCGGQEDTDYMAQNLVKQEY